MFQPIFLQLKQQRMATISAHNTFALSLYNTFASQNEGKNFLLSPISIFATLSMILPGAKRDTLQQMLEAMHLDKTVPLEVTQAALGKMLAATMATEASSSSELLMANKAYIEAGYAVNQDYMTALQNYFGAEAASADFSKNPDSERDKINKWVATVTKGKIADLLAPGSISPLTRLVLVNALYFKARWQIPFDPRHTRPADFESAEGASPVQVPMMHRTGNFSILYVPELLTGIRLDFEQAPETGQRLAMFAVLPAERHRLDALMSAMSPADWLKVLNTPTESSRAAVSLPKARLAGAAELSKPNYLPSLGLASMFSSSADLSGIASVPGDLHVSSFAHQAILEWDEFGAEGAAASAAVVNTRSMPPQFNFDQPFLVIVTAAEPDAVGSSRVPIFMGRVSDPSKGI